MDSSSDESGPTYPLPVVDTLPTFSKERYDQTYQLFRKWMVTKNRASLSQGVLLQFFNELATKKKPSTVWTYYSILKATIRANDNIDIRGYEVLTKFIKCKTTGYSPAKAGVFNAEDIHRFLKEAPDERWLDVKAACIFGISGACSSHEMPNIKLKDIEDDGNKLTVRMAKTRKKAERSFTIIDDFRDIVLKYSALRGANVVEQRFFLNYQRGKCTRQVIGRQKFAKMPRLLAKFLQLPDPNSYNGLSFRLTSQSFKNKTNNQVGNIMYIKPTNDSTTTTATNILPNSPLISSEIQRYERTEPMEVGRQPSTRNPNKKFGEIYCSPMGVLSYHCVLCTAQMEHSDEFSLHYMSHYRDVFQTNQQANDHDYGAPVDPLCTIKLEETLIKSEPIYDHDAYDES